MTTVDVETHSEAYKRQSEAIEKVLNGEDLEGMRCYADQFMRSVLKYKEAFLDGVPDKRQELHHIMHKKEDASELEKAQAGAIFNIYDVVMCLFAGIEEARFRTVTEGRRALIDNPDWLVEMKRKAENLPKPGPD